MAKFMSMKLSEEWAAKRGFLPAPHDHPIYSEGPSITFLQSTPKRGHSKVAPDYTTGPVSSTGHDRPK